MTAVVVFAPVGSAAVTDPIVIDGNDDLLAKKTVYGWQGTGTLEDPIIIDNETVDTPTPLMGISLSNIDLHVIIENCSVSGVQSSEVGSYGMGILISHSSNITLKDNVVRACDRGIVALVSNNITAYDNNILSSLDIGMMADNSRDLVFTENTITGGLSSITVVSGLYNTLALNTIINAEDDAIYLDGSSGNVVVGNTITGGNGTAVTLGSSYDNIIEDNTISQTYYGVSLYSGQGNIIRGNQITAVKDAGIYVCDLNRIYENYIWSLSGSGIDLNYGTGDLQGNVMVDCAIIMHMPEDADPELLAQDLVITSNNTVNGLPVLYIHDADMEDAMAPAGHGQIILLNVTRYNISGLSFDHAGIVLAYSNDITVHGNVFINATVAILLHGSWDCTIQSNGIAFYGGDNGNQDANGLTLIASQLNLIDHNTILFISDLACADSADWQGMFMMRSDLNTISENTFLVVGEGLRSFGFQHIQLLDGTGNVIEGNYLADGIGFEHSGAGISMYQCYDGRLSGNVIEGMPETGLYAFGCQYNEVIGNEITGSGGYGIYFYVCYYNDVIGNKLVDNNGVASTPANVQAYDDSNNVWNNASYGNYWSDWQTDLNNDGFADSPYLIDGYDKDTEKQADQKPVVVRIITASPEFPYYTNQYTLDVTGSALDGFGMVSMAWENLNSTDSGSCTGTAPWSATIALVEGNNTVRFTLTDALGFEFYIDRMIICSSGSQITFSPGSAIYTNESSVMVSFRIDDIAPMTSANYSEYQNGVLVGSGLLSGIAGQTSFNYLLDLGLVTGVNVFVIQVNDTVGNVDLFALTVYCDNVAPSASIDSPTAGTVSGSASMTITWHGDDISGIDHFDLSLDGGAWTSTEDVTYTYDLLTDGIHTVLLRTYDRAGNYRDVSVTFTVDTTEPTVTINGPASGAFIGQSSVQASWTVTDVTSGVETMMVRVDSQDWNEIASGTTFDFTGLADGAHTITVRAMDAAGNVEEVSTSFTVDTVAPVLSVTTPTEGSVTNLTAVTVTWGATDATSQVVGYRYRVDGGAWSAFSATTSVALTSLTHGPHIVEVEAKDSAGNVASTSRTFAVDTVAPTVTISSPVDGLLNNTGSVTISWSCTAADLDHCEISINGGAWTIAAGTSITLELDDGIYTVRVRAYDAAGNYGEDEVSFTVDTVAPSVSILAPVNGSYNNTGSVTVSWSSSDAVDHYAIKVNGGAWTAASGTSQVLDLDDGACTVYVRAYDAAGNFAEAQVSFTVDTEVPYVSISEPSALVNSTTVEVAWTSTGANYFHVKVDQGDWHNMTVSSYTATGLSQGSHTVVVKAFDNAGNTNVSSVTFTVDSVAPTVTGHAPTGEVDVDGTVITVTFSESMDRSSVRITAGVAGSLSWSGNTVTFTPNAALENGATYTVDVAGNDTAGNRVVYTWTFTTEAASQNGSLSGVVNGPDGQPLAGAIVTLSNGATTTTDSQGRYNFSNVAPGAYNVTVAKDGYQSETKSVTVSAGETATVSEVSMDLNSSTTPAGSNDLLLFAGIGVVAVVAVLGAVFMLRGRK